jgi:hypothetical protein
MAKPEFINVYGAQESILPAYVAWAGIFKQPMGARNRVGIGLPVPARRLHRPAELIPWHRFLGSLKVEKFGLWRAGTTTQFGIDSWGSLNVYKFGLKSHQEVSAIS